MNRVYPVRHPPVPAAASRGETTTSHAETRHAAADANAQRGGGRAAAKPDPQMPHEHDESSHSQAAGAASQGQVGNQAYSDVASGKQDTDKGPEMDKVYNEKIAPDRGSSEPRQ